MKTSLRIAKITTNFLASPSIKYQPKYLLSTQVKKAASRNLKLESEQKSIKVNIVPTVMSSREIETAEDWKNVRDDLFKSGKQITSLTIDSIILSYCIGAQNYDLGYSYMEFLKTENIKPGLAAVGKYLKLFYLRNCDRVLKESDENYILDMYKDLRKKYKLLDATTCENVIHALSITKHWKECLKLLDEIKITCSPGVSAYSVIVAAAFANNENDLAWKLLDEIVVNDRTPQSVAYLSYIKQCKKMEHLEKLFEFFRLNVIKCDTEVARSLSHHLNACTAVINSRGICQNCKQKLQKLELNAQEFEDLKTGIFKNVIVGKNVFFRTTPDELRSFQDFVANMKKYDVVIDGLNVAYSLGVKQPSRVLSSLLLAVVKHFANQNKKVLVLGRRHMSNWSKSDWSYITQNADTFLAQSLSQDDPYLLYCALHSGLNTVIVSKDLMRSHLFKLSEPRLKLLFSQWLTLSQHQLLHVNNQGKPFFKYPPSYSRTAQKLQNCWHIPYDEALSDGAVASKWLCLNI